MKYKNNAAVSGKQRLKATHLDIGCWYKCAVALNPSFQCGPRITERLWSGETHNRLEYGRKTLKLSRHLHQNQLWVLRNFINQKLGISQRMRKKKNIFRHWIIFVLLLFIYWL